jgi:hypothetical protein
MATTCGISLPVTNSLAWSLGMDLLCSRSIVTVGHLHAHLNPREVATDDPHLTTPFTAARAISQVDCALQHPRVWLWRRQPVRPAHAEHRRGAGSLAHGPCADGQVLAVPHHLARGVSASGHPRDEDDAVGEGPNELLLAGFSPSLSCLSTLAKRVPHYHDQKG